MQIGSYQLANPLILAPMAGVTDRPFRQICRRMGAAMAVSEMVTSEKRLWKTDKSRLRLDYSGEREPISVQILGTDPVKMAEAARFNVEQGAQIIDINMGCPAKKVCNVAAGSALLRNEALVGKILDAIVAAVSVPVTLKIRTGWDIDSRNAERIARIAEEAGIAALTVHGRTRACKFNGEAEYDTIASVKSSVSIPVIANGDITSPEKAKHVLEYTGADALMIGRAAQGRPWIFREIDHYLRNGSLLSPPNLDEVSKTMLEHVSHLHSFYGDYMGVKIARKHISWYCQSNEQLKEVVGIFRKTFNQIELADEQLQKIEQMFLSLQDASLINSKTDLTVERINRVGHAL